MKLEVAITAELAARLSLDKPQLFQFLMNYPAGQRARGKYAPVRLEIAGMMVWLKRECYPSWWEKLRGWHRFTLLGRSKSCSEWCNLQWLQQHEIPVGMPLAFGESRQAGFVHQAFLLTRDLPATQVLDQWVRQHAHDVRKRARVIQHLAVVTGRMHRAGFIYRDLHWRNILVDAQEQVFLIDCPKGKAVRPGADKRPGMAFDLGSLDTYAPQYCSRSERRRFLAIYGETLGTDLGDLRDLLRSIHQVSRRTREKDRRKKRSYYYLHSQALGCPPNQDQCDYVHQD